MYLSKRVKLKRANVFNNYFSITTKTKILDLGSSNGSHIFNLLHGKDVQPSNVYIADVDSCMVNSGVGKYGFTPVIIQKVSKLPFSDNYFDIVFCNSVIEHVTVPKKEVWSLYSGSEFRRSSLLHQKEFADEIRRIGKGYWVQSPNKYFPIETYLASICF